MSDFPTIDYEPNDFENGQRLSTMKEPPISRDRRFGGFLYPDQAGGFRADGPEPSASGMSEKVHFSIHRGEGRKSTENFLCLGVDNKIYSVYIKGTKEIQCFVP